MATGGQSIVLLLASNVRTVNYENTNMWLQHNTDINPYSIIWRAEIFIHLWYNAISQLTGFAILIYFETGFFYE